MNSLICMNLAIVGAGGGGSSVEVKAVVGLVAVGQCWGWWQWRSAGVGGSSGIGGNGRRSSVHLVGWAG